MENTRTMAIQMPEETYQRLKAYLKRHKVKQKDFVISLVEAAMNDSGTDESESAEDHPGNFGTGGLTRQRHSEGSKNGWVQRWRVGACQRCQLPWLLHI